MMTVIKTYYLNSIIERQALASHKGQSLVFGRSYKISLGRITV